MRIAFLGPVGTYGEQAAQAFAKLEQWEAPELLPQTGIRAVIQALAAGRVEAAVVPVENSVEGGVTACLDALWEHPELEIARAVVLPIRHALVGSGSVEGVSEVLSHPQALAQCSLWLSNNLPNALQLPTSSTAEAARKRASGSGKRWGFTSTRLPRPIFLSARAAAPMFPGWEGSTSTKRSRARRAGSKGGLWNSSLTGVLPD